MKMLALFIFLITNMTAFAQPKALGQLVYEIRNPQTDSAHFRQALEKIGEYLALSVLQELSAHEVTIQTLTGVEAKHQLLDETPILVTILRAGLPLNAGVQKVFPNAEVGFLAMSRNEETLKATVDYIALPDLKNRTLILTDTMLATGGSLIDAIKIVEQYGPKKIIIVAAIASEPGIARIRQYDPTIKIFAAAVDPLLNDKGYIIPGLGDAGDRSYGKKEIQYGHER